MRRFTWDAKKARSNLADHKVAFETACTVFDDPNAQIRLDDEPTEERWRITGMTREGALLFVVYTERDENEGIHTHIISARKTTKRERETYFAGDP